MSVVAAVFVAALVAAGALSGGTSTTGFAPGRPVLVISVPDLRWSDLAAGAPVGLVPPGAAMAVLSIPHRDDPSGIPWAAAFTVSSGWPVIVGGERLADPVGAPETHDGAVCVPAVTAFGSRAAGDDRTGAEPGALGSAIRGEGGDVVVVGGVEALASVADRNGCVDAWRDLGDPPGDAFDDPSSVAAQALGMLDAAVSTPTLTWVEFGGLRESGPDVEADRRRLVVRGIDGAVSGLEQAWRRVAPDTVVVILAPTAPGGAATVAPLLIDEPSDGQGDGGPAALVSATTRRSGYVTLADLASTLVGLAGASVPDSMGGTPIGRAADGAALGGVAGAADVVERAVVRDAAVGAVAVVVVGGVFTATLAGLLRRHRSARAVARWVLPCGALAASASFALGWVPYHRLGGSTAVTVAVVTSVVAAVALLGTAVLGALSRRGRVDVLWLGAAVLWVLMVVDLSTGQHLQIGTPLGYSPTIAGRFSGFGNVAFGLFAASALVVAAGGRRRWSHPAAAAIGAVTVVVVAAPGLGSDVGGTLALVPAWIVLLQLRSGRRVGLRGAVGAGFAAAVVVAVAAAVDLSRPEAERTHLGRFVGQIGDGEAFDVISRKLASNVELFTATVWPSVLVAVGAGAAVVVARSRRRAGSERRPLFADRDDRATAAAFAVAAVLGFAVNDSGIAVPAAMLVLALPWWVGRMLAEPVGHAEVVGEPG